MRNLALKLSQGWALAGGVLLLAIMLVTSINIAGFGLDRLARHFDASVPGLPGYEDFVSLAISSAALMFMPFCQMRRGHIAVDLFVARLPRRLQRLFERLWLCAIVLVCLFLGYWMWFGMLETRADHVRSAILGWPVWPFYVPGIVSLALWAYVAALQIPEPQRHV
jgi:TRAP-type C4-dicarboxylate transport system permease small subunit